MQVRDEERGSVVFRRDGGGRSSATTSWSAPFDFPVTARPGAAHAAVRLRRRSASPETAPGLRLTALARPAPSLRASTVIAYFDGRDLRACCPAARARGE